MRSLLLKRCVSSVKFNLRGKLKHVYLRVHPDRLNNELSEDKIRTNQNSLAVLNDFVDTVQTKCSGNRRSHRNEKHRYDMVFYYKEGTEKEEKRGVVKLRIPKTLSGENRWKRYAERSVRTIEMCLGLREKEIVEDEEDEDRPVRRSPRRTTSKMTQTLMKRMGFDKDSIQKMERDIRSTKHSGIQETRSRDRAAYEDKIVTRVLRERFDKTNPETKKRLYDFLVRYFDRLNLDSDRSILLSAPRIQIGRRFSSETTHWEIPLAFRDADLLDFFRFQRERMEKRRRRKSRKS